MPHAPGIGFSPPLANTTPTIDLTEVPQKSKPAKKRMVVKEKPVIVELDDGKEDVDLIKNIGPWKDHWVIQLIILRGEMQNTFDAPPKQGMQSSLVFFNVDIMFQMCPSRIW